MTKAQDMSDRAAALGFSAFFGRTGGYTFKRDTLDVRVGNLASSDALLTLIEKGVEAEKSLIASSNAFNAAINYALKLPLEGMIFLRLWNEGAWKEIAAEFPDFNLGENAPEANLTNKASPKL